MVGHHLPQEQFRFLFNELSGHWWLTWGRKAGGVHATGSDGRWGVPLSGDGDRRGELQDAPAGNRGVWPLRLHDLGYSPPGCHKTSSSNIRSEERANKAGCVPASSPLGCFSYTRGELLKLMKLK